MKEILTVSDSVESKKALHEIPKVFQQYVDALVEEVVLQNGSFVELLIQGGAFVLVAFFASFLHWWSLLLIPIAVYFIFGDNLWEID